MPGAAGKAEMKALSLNESPSEKEGKSYPWVPKTPGPGIPQ